MGCPCVIPRYGSISTRFLLVAEGVLQAEKDFNLASHPEIEGIPNLQVLPP